VGGAAALAARLRRLTLPVESRMRVLVAPDKFAGTLTAAQAAAAIAAGWRGVDADAELDLLPVSDGGPGFLAAVQAAVGGERLPVEVSGPLGGWVPAEVLRAGSSAYVESAQACGLHLLPASRRDPARASSYGVGELLLAAATSGADRVVVGVGGTATNDGGAGLLAALGVQPAGVLRSGGGALERLWAPVDVRVSRHRLASVELVAAVDVDNPLLGPDGATAGYAKQKGADAAAVALLEAGLSRWSTLTGGDPDRPGAGAGGGIGYALQLAGATVEPGGELVLRLARAAERVRAVDLVVTGEGSLDWQSLRGKAVGAVAALASRHGRPCVVLAGQVAAGRRELAAAGVTEAHALAESAGSPAAAMAHPAEELARLAGRVASTWTRAG